jgi:cell division septal protein FtsQ
MSEHPLRERRRRAARWFLARVFVLLVLIGGVAYAAWFAPWARPVRHISVDVTR